MKFFFFDPERDYPYQVRRQKFIEHLSPKMKELNSVIYLEKVSACLDKIFHLINALKENYQILYQSCDESSDADMSKSNTSEQDKLLEHIDQTLRILQEIRELDATRAQLISSLNNIIKDLS